MATFIRSVLALLPISLVAALPITAANANGVNPPRPAGGNILQADCTLRSSGEHLVLRRALLLTHEGTATLPLNSRETGDVELDLEDIRTLQIPKSKLDPTGSLKVQATLAAPLFSGNATVKPGTKAAAIEIVGYDKAQNRRKILLTGCSALTVSKRDALDHEQPKRAESKK